MNKVSGASLIDCNNADLFCLWCRSEKPLFHVVSYTQLECTVPNCRRGFYLLSIFVPGTTLLVPHVSQNRMLSRSNIRAFYSFSCAFGREAFRFFGVSDIKFLIRSRHALLAQNLQQNWLYTIWKLILEMLFCQYFVYFHRLDCCENVSLRLEKNARLLIPSVRCSHPENSKQLSVSFEGDMEIMGTFAKFQHVFRWQTM